jgi:5-(carboxyamino)imidazole ribonucleotide synthase
MEKLVTSQFKLGIIAGGQLGKMLSLAASNWDVKTYILDKDLHCPAAPCSTEVIVGDPLNFDDVYQFGQRVDMVTYELEAINTDALKKLVLEGRPVLPEPEALEVIQDKGLQKSFFSDHAIPTSSYTLFTNKTEIEEAINAGSLSYPFVQKLRKGGYDGRGVSIINSQADLEKVFDAPSVVEDLVPIQAEISVIAARNPQGEVKCFPVAEMEFNEQANLVELLVCPSPIDSSIQDEAVSIASRVIDSLKLTGLLAIEMFLDASNKLWVNEVAPRPHNSGHHTIESIVTSQYEQLLRAIFGFPLGSTHIKMPSAMINLLGEPGVEGPVKYEGLSQCLEEEGVKVHLYGKKTTKPFRKMGHITILAPTLEEAKAKAKTVKSKLKVTSWKSH